ncbi:unnamed protein product [Nippostrongylus brasiliensis]|uniref:Reverse transcriptase domain-containing protein n=1 Tax=Nippostrongylus brasiliensis TaxID=27835 RepID=A0A0N4Y8B6_NIPBR|nr:unnamed protein product [Nippostrongylus brasiliensis]
MKKNTCRRPKGRKRAVFDDVLKDLYPFMTGEPLRTRPRRIQQRRRIQSVAMAIEVCRENHLPLFLTFFAYEKAFASIEANTSLSAKVDTPRAGRSSTKTGLLINRKKAQYLKSSCCDEGTSDSDLPRQNEVLCLPGALHEHDNDMKKEVIKRRVAWSAYGSLKEATEQLLLTSMLICSIRQFFLFSVLRG